MEKLVVRLLLWNWRLVATLFVVGLGTLIVLWPKVPPEVPLLYTRPWGQEQLVNPVALYLLPTLTLITGLLGWWWGNRRGGAVLLKSMILLSGMVVQLIVTTGLLRILFLVTS